jgi:hypothetical protein
MKKETLPYIMQVDSHTTGWRGADSCFGDACDCVSACVVSQTRVGRAVAHD